MKKIYDNTTITTATFYNPNDESDKYRAVLAKNAVKKATDLGYHVTIVDGGSPDELLKEFERYGAKVCMQSLKGLGNSRRQAFREAYNTGKQIIAWTEPEKEDYIPNIVDTVLPIITDGADLVVPARKSLESYPKAQQYAEILGNAFWKEITGTNLDIWFGPKTWKRELSNYFLDYNGEYGDKWEHTFIPVMNAVFAGKKVVGVEVDYTHPAKQTNIEEHSPDFYMKRVEQLDNLMSALYKNFKNLTESYFANKPSMRV